MGQKVNPHGLRVGVIKNWDSRWFVSDKKFGDNIVSDKKIRESVKTKLQGAGVPKIEIERDAARVRVFIQCAKPGVVIGFHGAEIEKLRAELEAMAGCPVVVNVIEIKNPDVNAQAVGIYLLSHCQPTSFSFTTSVTWLVLLRIWNALPCALGCTLLSVGPGHTKHSET